MWLIVASKLGYLVPVVGIGTAFLVRVPIDAALRLFDVAQALPVAPWISLAYAGVITWLFGFIVNLRYGRMAYDKETGERVIIKPDHTFFFITIDLWGIIIVLLAIAAYLDDLLGG